MGWGVGVGITLVVVSLEFKNYGGDSHFDALDVDHHFDQYFFFYFIINILMLWMLINIKYVETAGAYHCWLQMDSTLMLGQVLLPLLFNKKPSIFSQVSSFFSPKSWQYSPLQ